MKKFIDFASKGCVVHFPAGTTNESIPTTRLGKLATVLSVVGAVAITTPSAAEARGGGAIMGLIGGMMIGSMMTRGAVAAPMYSAPAYATPSYGTPYAPASPYGYGAPGYTNYGPQGGAAGTYYCPRGPQYKCYWRGSQLEIHDDLNKAAELDMDAAPAPRMG